MVTQGVEHSRPEVVELPRSFPLRISTGTTDFSGRYATFEYDGAILESDSEALTNTFEQLDDRFRSIMLAQVERYRDDLALDPTNASLLNNLGLALLNNGESKEALAYLEEALRGDPSLWSAKANIVRALVAEGDVEAALNRARSLAKSDDTLAALSLLARVQALSGARDEAISTYGRIITRWDKDSFALYNRGVQYLLSQQPAKAVSDMRRSLALRPRAASAHNALGVCYMALGAIRKAAQQFEVAVNLEASPGYTRNMCNALVMSGDLDRALSTLRDHVARYPADTRTRETFATVLREAGRPQDCLREMLILLRSAEETESTDLPRLNNNLGVVYSELGKIEFAEERFMASMEHWDNPVPFQNLERALIATRNLRKARLIFERFADKFEDAVTLTLGARLAELDGNYDQAQQLCQEAVRLHPAHPDGYLGLSRLKCEVTGECEQAIDLLKDGLTRCSDTAPLMNNLAYAYLMLDRPKDARDILDQIPDEDHYATVATRGLLLIREGSWEEGSRLYTRAASTAKDPLTKKLVEQKRKIELARFWHGRGDLIRASELVSAATDIDAGEPIFARQARKLADDIWAERRRRAGNGQD